jgi:hypothetical protein
MQKGKIFSKNIFFKICFLCSRYLRSRNRDRNLSKVGTGTVKNSYGSTTLVQKAPPGLAMVGLVLVSCDIERGGGGSAQGQQGGEQGGRQVHLAPSNNIPLFATIIRHFYSVADGRRPKACPDSTFYLIQMQIRIRIQVA